MAKHRSRAYVQVNIRTLVKRLDEALKISMTNTGEGLTLVAELRSLVSDLGFGYDNELNSVGQEDTESEERRKSARRPSRKGKDTLESGPEPAERAEPAPAAADAEPETEVKPRRTKSKSVGRSQDEPGSPKELPLPEDCTPTIVDGKVVDITAGKLNLIPYNGDTEYTSSWWDRWSPERKREAFELYGNSVVYLRAGLIHCEMRYREGGQPYYTDRSRYKWFVGKHREDVFNCVNNNIREFLEISRGMNDVFEPESGALFSDLPGRGGNGQG